MFKCTFYKINCKISNDLLYKYKTFVTTYNINTVKKLFLLLHFILRKKLQKACERKVFE